MKPATFLASLVLLISVLGAPARTLAQTGNANMPPPDPWPRVVNLADAQVLVYQPQVNAWTGNQLDFRAALAIKPNNAKAETFGVIFAATRTQVDKVLRTVTFENLRISKIDFPTLPNHGAAYAAELQSAFAKSIRTISLDRLDSSLALSGIKPPTVAVQNIPPWVIVSYSPAILVPIDGAPVLKPVPSNASFQRVINTRALILQGGVEQNFYIHVYDGWLESSSISGPWTQSFRQPLGMDGTAQTLAKSGAVDMLDGGAKANPKPSLANGVPAIYTSQVPTELIVFKGQPDFQPVVGTQLLWAANTTSDVLIDISNNNYYVLISGRWFEAPAITGPWAFVAADALPPDFARIPPQAPAGAVLPTVAGTPQAQEAAISNTIPQTATIPLSSGPTFTPNFDGPPQYLPIDGTAMSYVANSSEPVIQVAPSVYFAVVAGVWFTAAQVTGPWIIATSVPSMIYTIPPASPLYYVTYVKIYEATPQYVYVGYTPGYFGTVISPYGTVVYGTGYAYSPWIGTVWYPPPYTYGVAAAPVYNPWVGFTFGFAVGLATAAWLEPYWGGSWYSPTYWGHYPCCATASANVYGHWGGAVYSGTRSWYAGGGVAGSTFSGSYATARGTTGSVNAGRQYNAWTGNASRGYDNTFNTAAGGSGNAARGTNYNTYTGQRSTANAVSGTTANGSTYNRAGATTAGPQGAAHTGGGSVYNANTGKTSSWGADSTGNNHYADSDGNVYRGSDSGWQQHSSSGWSGASGNTSWADNESAARSAGDDRSSDFSNSFGGGGLFGGDRGGGGLFGGDRGGGGGFGGFGGGGGGGWGGRFGGGGGFRR
ncbi:MAG: hypothetical protein ACLPV8_10305 [Steroidobacteraceae bacterium]